MSEDSLLVELRPRGVAWLTLNRPDVHNAFDDRLIASLSEAFRRLAADASVRAVVLAANGKSFSAGADLNWMRRCAAYSEAENLADARELGHMLKAIYEFDRPVIARVQGSAFGGGLGLVAACDIAIAAEGAAFMLTEVRLGLIPAVISPYVIAAVGERAVRRYAVTAERIGADEARRLGLVHEVVAAEALDQSIDGLIARIVAAGPGAVTAAKDLVRSVAGRPINDDMVEDTARRIAESRAQAEGREGVAAFLEKREPSWRMAGEE